MSDISIYSNMKREYGVIHIDKLMPLFCAMAAFKYCYNYYEFAFPFLSNVIEYIYKIITFFLLIVFIPIFIRITKKAEWKIFIPAMIIPIVVLVNTFFVSLSGEGLSILSREYKMISAIGTNDENGFYFSQINTWFGNIAVLLIIGAYVKKREDIIKCVLSTMITLIIPTLVIMISHPAYLGTRQSIYDNGMKFGGGLWNIGVVGFGSVSWLGMSLIKWCTKAQRRIMLFSILVFVFVGVAGISRTLILMLCFSVSFYFLLNKKNSSWFEKVILVLFCIVIFCFFEKGFIISIVNRFNDSTSGTQNIRLKLWKSYLSHYKEYWLIGAPEGSVYNYYRDISLNGFYFLPHSAPINFLVRYGVIACLAYIFMIKKAFFEIQKFKHVSKQTRICIFSGSIAYITLAFINQTGYAESVFYIMFGLLLGYLKIELINRKNKDENRYNY